MSHVRWAYGVLSVAMSVVLVCLSDQWATSDTIDAFTYWCGVATLVALVIAVGEVFHAGAATSAVNLALSAAARHEARTLSLEVIALVDEVSERTRQEDYTAALRAAQIARRFAGRLDSGLVLLSEVSALSTQLCKVEHVLHRTMNVHAGTTMTRSARSALNDTLMEIKVVAEKLARPEAGV